MSRMPGQSGMISIELEQASFQRLRLYLGDKPKQFGKVLAGAVNDTARQQRTRISRRIRDVVNIKAKDINPRIKIARRATPAHPTATIRLSESERLNLAYFGARQTKKGVTAKIDKRGKRRLWPGAFMGPRPGVLAPKLHGNVFRRASGRGRLPIIKLNVLSPWGAYVKNPQIEQETLRDSRELLANNINRRLRFVLLKEAGAI